MNCPKCGKSNKDSARFCVYCGTSLAPERSEAKSPEKTISKKGKPTTKIIIGVVIAISILFLGSRLLGGFGLAGKYINIENEDDTMELLRDGTFYSIESGVRTRGEYKVKGKRVVFTLNVLGMDLSVECTKVGNGFDCETGDRYRK